MSLLLMTVLTAADARFLHDYAETRRFMAGRPASAKITPDNTAVLFLRSKARDASQMLYEFDVKTGQTRELLTPEKVLQGAAQTLSVAEKARLERMRVMARGFTSFQMSTDGRLLLVTLSGRLYVVERSSGQVTALKTGEGACLDAKFSPDGTKVGYVRANDVWVVTLKTNRESAVTRGGTDEEPNGLAEFVAQEEMHRFSGFWFSPDSKRIAFQHTSHHGMERFTIADPLHPEVEGAHFPYPRPGQKNAEVTVLVADISKPKQPLAVKWNAGDWPYLATVKWQKGGPLTLVVQNREQTREQILTVDTVSGETMPIHTEEDAAWLKLHQEFPRWVDDGSGFLWLSERAGTPDIELRKRDGSLEKVLAKNANGFAGASAAMETYLDATRALYFYSGADSTQGGLFRSVDGAAAEAVKSPVGGPATQSATVSNDGSLLVVTSTSLNAMPKSWVVRADGTVVGELPSVAEEPTLRVNAELVKLPGPLAFEAAVIRPTQFVAGQKYPVVLQVYGGPGHLEVAHSMRENLPLQWLADQGFIVVKLDGRGTPRRGREFERAIKGDFATITAGDQIAGLQQLLQRVPEMDAKRVGVYGWSFGGYLAALLALSKPEQIRCAVAGAPVVDWYDYDTHYTERYLGVPQGPNDKAYQVSSLLTYVADAKRPILLMHGTADDNVYFMHTLKLSDAMFKAGKAHSVLPLSNFTHMVPDPLVMQRQWERIAGYFKENL